MLEPLARRGELERAHHHHRTGYALARRLPKLVEAHAQHLVFAAEHGHSDEAVSILDRHLSGALEYPTAWERMVFLAALTRAARALRAARIRSMPFFLGGSAPRLALRARTPPGLEARLRERQLGLPEDAGLPEEPSLETLGGWARAQARELAAAFDARNGNDVVSRWLDGKMP